MFDAASGNVQNAGSSILASLKAGNFVTITQGGAPLYVAADTQDTPRLANGAPPPGAITSFLVVTYEYNGTDEAKIFLQPNDMPGQGWSAGTSLGGSFPVVIGAPTCFLLDDAGNGQVTIQNTTSPPGPFVHGATDPASPYVSYGYVEAGDAGKFTISIVS